MSHTQDTIVGAIDRSISHDEIVTVTVELIETAYSEIAADAEDYTDTQDQDGRPLREVWGITDDGDEWRVHLLQVA